MKYFKRLDLVIGLDFHNNFVVALVTNFTSGSIAGTLMRLNHWRCRKRYCLVSERN